MYKSLANQLQTTTHPGFSWCTNAGEEEMPEEPDAGAAAAPQGPPDIGLFTVAQ